MDALEDEVRRARHFFGVRKVLVRHQPLPEGRSKWLVHLELVIWEQGQATAIGCQPLVKKMYC